MTLTISPEGQVTFPREALDHLGVEPGQDIALDLLPNGRADLHANHTARQRTPEERAAIEAVIGYWKTDKQVSIDEMNETIAKGWAGLLDDDDD